ncbi:MAG: hypothetical protein ACC707_07440 [Thiohalomonadales bacterium]
MEKKVIHESDEKSLPQLKIRAFSGEIVIDVIPRKKFFHRTKQIGNSKVMNKSEIAISPFFVPAYSERFRLQTAFRTAKERCVRNTDCTAFATNMQEEQQ